MSDGPLLLCMRVADAVRVAEGSVMTPCSVCGTDLWVSATGLAHAGPLSRPICATCLEPLISPDTTVLPPSREQLAEVAEARARQRRP